jgi:hypothetical protein
VFEFTQCLPLYIISVRPNKFLNTAFRRFDGGKTQNKGKKSKHFYREEIGIEVKESGIKKIYSVDHCTL